MGYLAVWKVLEEMIVDFRKRGIAVPEEIIGDLKNAKTIMQVLKADPSRGEIMQKIDGYLGNVQSYLVSEGQKQFGIAYVEEWLKRADNAGRKTLDDEEETRFIPGLPREQKWIRVTPSTELPIDKLKTLADEAGLAHTVQNDGCLLVYGEDKNIKDFVKRMSTKYASKKGKSAAKST